MLGVIEFPPVKPGDPVRISASTFVDFLRCPASADARLHRVFGPDTRASFSGGLAHRVFARHLGQGSIDPNGFHQVCREEIGSSALNMKMAGLGLGKPSMLAPVIDEVQVLYQRFRSVPVEGFVGAEVELAAEPADGVSLVGKVDAVFGDDRGSRLVDWKTGELGEPLVQLQFYGLLWALQENELPGRLEAVSVRTGERFSTVPSRAELEEVARQVAEMVTRLRTAWASGAELEVCGGPWCRYCPLLEECGEGSAAVGQGDRAGGPGVMTGMD
jgi:PD-(D/E)XK nuclease superfamily